MYDPPISHEMAREMGNMNKAYTRINRNTLAQFKRDREKMTHVSADAHMINNPLAIEANRAGSPFAGPKLIPYIQSPGITYNFGKNRAKRDNRVKSLGA